MNKEFSANIEKFIDGLELELTQKGDNFQGTTQCHGGDAIALSVYLCEDGLYRWKCFTRECEKEWGNNLLGLMKCIKGKYIDIECENLPLKKKSSTNKKLFALLISTRGMSKSRLNIFRKEDFLRAFWLDII